MTTKLNDLQLILLVAATNRLDGNLLPAPDSVGTDTDRVDAAVTSLIRRKLAIGSDDGVMITEAGRVAIGASDSEMPEGSDAVPDNASGDTAPTPDVQPGASRSGTKAATLVELLTRRDGASLDDLIAATGWLPHTVRAALTGLRKKGHRISRSNTNGGSRYQIVA